MSDAHSVARDQLRAFIDRIERLEEEKKTIADDIKDVYGEAKAMGYDTKIMKQVIALRKKDDQERNEEDIVREMYLAALGMIPDFEADREAAPVASKKNSNKPAMALQSPRKAAEAVSERIRINQPDAAGEMQHPGSHPIGNPEPALAAANRPNGDDGMVRMARTEAAAVTDRRDDHLNSETDAAISRPELNRPETENGSEKEAAEAAVSGGMHDESAFHPAALIAPASQGEAEALTGSTSGKTHGGDHEEVAHEPAAQAEAIVSETVSATPGAQYLLRPHCQQRDMCRSGTTDHCHTCRKAMAEGVSS